MDEIRLVDVPDAPLVFGWADPESLDENPLNWKIHTDFQTEVVAELIRKHGWVKPLVYNRRTSRLLDGHDRRKIAIMRGDAVVPVAIGDWPEEQEPEIIASLDPSGALAKTDAAKLDAVMKQFRDPAPVIQDMMTRLAESEGVMAYLKRDQTQTVEANVTVGGKTGDDEPDDDDDGGGVPTSILMPTSQVRMVQLFFPIAAYDEFREYVDDLAEVYDTGPDVDTILACLREAHRNRVTNSTLLDPE